MRFTIMKAKLLKECSGRKSFRLKEIVRFSKCELKCANMCNKTKRCKLMIVRGMQTIMVVVIVVVVGVLVMKAHAWV